MTKDKKDKKLIKEITNWLDYSERTHLVEMCQIADILGHDVSTLEHEFLALLNKKLPHKAKSHPKVAA